jgi:hypothetical protein
MHRARRGEVQAAQGGQFFMRVPGIASGVVRYERSDVGPGDEEFNQLAGNLGQPGSIGQYLVHQTVGVVEMRDAPRLLEHLLEMNEIPIHGLEQLCGNRSGSSMFN